MKYLRILTLRLSDRRHWSFHEPYTRFYSFRTL